MQPKRFCIVATVPFALKWYMTPHIRLLSEQFELTLVSNGEAEDLADLLENNVTFVPLCIKREISIVSDFLALIKLWRLFRSAGFDCVHSILPKSGLLSMLAARMAGVPVRVHTFTGQVWANKHGLKRNFLKFFDRVLARNATHVLADSHSQAQFLRENNVVKPASISVLADGSICGVDTGRFRFSADERDRIRRQHEIAADAVVFLFLGRLSKDKGLLDLISAFETAAQENRQIHLLVVGPDEDDLEGKFDMLSIRLPGRVHRVGYTDSPQNYMSAADVFCLPSYREGFGSVIIEAAAIGLPAIASRIYGITDALVDGVTGILHAPRADSEISKAMLLLANDESYRSKLGQAAQDRVEKCFTERRLVQAFGEFYQDIFQHKKSSPGKSE